VLFQNTLVRTNQRAIWWGTGLSSAD